MAKRNFYKKSGDSKKVLKKIIRPTHKKISKKTDISESDEVAKKENPVSAPKTKPEDSDLRSLLMSPPDLDTIRHTTKENREITTEALSAPIDENQDEDDEVDTKGSSLDDLVDNEIEVKTPDTMDETTHTQNDETTEELEPREFSKAPESSEETKQTQSEIDEIQRIIQQASSRLQDLEKQKREEEERKAKESENVVVEKFDGVSDSSEEIALIKEELAHYQKENKRLQHELSLIKEDFTKEKELLEKTVKELKKKSHTKNPVEDNTFFSFSDQLKDALEMIDTLNDPNFKPHQSEVVIPQAGTTNSQMETKPAPKKLNLTMPKVIKVDEAPKKEKPEEEKKEAKQEEKKIDQEENSEKSPKDKKYKGHTSYKV